MYIMITYQKIIQTPQILIMQQTNHATLTDHSAHLSKRLSAISVNSTLR